MRLQVASFHCWFSLLLLNSITRALTTDEFKKHDFRKPLSGSNSLMDSMMKKYSYPKNEVTAGVGYGHHLHPFYYQGGKEIMYPCAVECGEWETMDMEDNANDGSSNVDVVTVRPDVSKIDITTSKSPHYKDISFLRPKKYQSKLFSGAQKTDATSKSNRHVDFDSHQESKSANIRVMPHKTSNGYQEESDTTEMPNDGSLYAKYHDALISGYGRELNGDHSENKEYFDPLEESMRYNSPSFNDGENDDIDAPVYPTELNSLPERGRIEEKYVKHNVREERLEDVRTNSFGPSGGGEKYLSDSSNGKKPSSYNPPKYIDDYAAPLKPYDSYPPNQNYNADNHKDEFSGSDNGAPFRPSPPHGHNEPQKLHPFYKNPRNKIPQRDYDGYSDYQAEDYGVEGEDYDEHPVKSVYYGLSKAIYHGKNHPRDRLPPPRNRRPSYGRNQKYHPIHGVGNRHRAPYAHLESFSYPPKFPGKPYYGSHPRSLYSENAMDYPHRPYAPRHGYSSQSQKLPLRLNSGGMRVVSPPKIRHGKFPYSKRRVRTSPHSRGQRVSYRRTIPQKNGFTTIVKNFRSFIDHTPKRFVGSGQSYGTP